MIRLKNLLTEQTNNNCILLQDLAPWLIKHGYENINGAKDNALFNKFCGNVESQILISSTHPREGGCVHKVESWMNIYHKDVDLNGHFSDSEIRLLHTKKLHEDIGGVIWNDLDKVNFDPNLSADDLIAMIEDSLKTDYDKYATDITNCDGLV